MHTKHGVKNRPRLALWLLLAVLISTVLAACASDSGSDDDPEITTNSDSVAEDSDSFASDTTADAAIITEEETKEVENTVLDTSPLRIMYYNVYGYGNLDSIPDRIGVQVEMIADAAPDVVCTQEFDSRHRETAKPLLKEKGYKEVPVTKLRNVVYPEGKNCVAMFYLPDRLKLVTSGGEQYPEWVTVEGVDHALFGNNVNSKSITWAIFEELSSGKLFLVINTHFMWTDTSQLTVEEANLVRVTNAERVIALISEIRAKDEAYADIPVVFGGDLNCQMDKDPVLLLSETLTPACEAAEEYEKIGYYGCYATYDAASGEYTYREPKESDNIIDHAFVQGVTVHSYLPVTEFRALITSDHLPWMLEITLADPDTTA